MLDDHKIIELFWQRSETAIKEVKLKYARYCHSIAFRILQNKEDAEECVNESLHKLWDTIPPDRPSILRTFLGRITRNLSLNYLEKSTAGKRGDGQVELILSELEESIPTNNLDLGNMVDEKFVVDVINQFLEKTEVNQRKVFVRRYWYGSSTKEIGEDFGFSVSKVNSILFRLRKNLKKELEKEGISL